MDVVLQKHEGKRVFPVPDGLKELSSDIVREVLRHQPECIHAFVAEYLETMLVVREKARDAAVVVSDVFREGYFFEDLYRTKRVTREMANAYASIIQAGWRGYVVRKKFRMYLQKRRKTEEEKELEKALKIEEFLASVGITYDEATRAACLIQAAYRQARRGRWVVNELGEEVWMEGEDVPMGQRIREGDKAQGRYDRWNKEDWGDFFNLDEQGEIAYKWPRVGQLRRIPRKHLRPDMEIVQFYAMRDLQGKEQYSYLKESQKGRDPRGFPIGFLIPLTREFLREVPAEVGFVNHTNAIRMGTYTYVFERKVEKEDLKQFAEVLKARKAAGNKMKPFNLEYEGEFDYDPEWVLPKIMVQIRKDCLMETDDEVYFYNEESAPQINGAYTFRAENTEISLKVFNYLLKHKCMSVEDAMADAANIMEYRERGTGRFLPVEDFESPKYVQKVVIVPETETAEFENDDMDNYEYVFVQEKYGWRMKMPKPDNPIQIPITRFQGYHSDYLGSCGLENNVFIMGPMLHSPDGKPLTYESLFWDEFGPECWYQLLCNLAMKKIARLSEPMAEEEEEDKTDAELGEEEQAAESEMSTKTKPSSAKKSKTEVTEATESVTPESAKDPEPIDEPEEVPEERAGDETAVTSQEEQPPSAEPEPEQEQPPEEETATEAEPQPQEEPQEAPPADVEEENVEAQD